MCMRSRLKDSQSAISWWVHVLLLMTLITARLTFNCVFRIRCYELQKVDGLLRDMLVASFRFPLIVSRIS